MFRELRLRLTIFNASIIAILFVLLISGTYWFVDAQIKERSFFFMTKAAEDIMTGRFSVPPPPPGPLEATKPFRPPGPPRPLLFYLQTDSANQIIFASDTSPLDLNRLQQLAFQTLSAEKRRGEIHFEHKPYCYVVVPHPHLNGHLLVFEDFEDPRALLHLLITALIAIGLFCLALSFLGSFFMAERAMRPIRIAWQQQKDFVADASHELRTPLAVIQANLDIVRDNPDETVASQIKWIENVRDGLSSMTLLVDSLLFLARHDAQQIPMRKETFDLTAAVNNELESLRPVLRNCELLWTESIESDIQLTGDSARIRQVVRILMDNAIRHTPKAGTIQVTLHHEDHATFLTVKNSGDDIPPELIERIFERFYQADRSRANSGTGLGLAIARCIISAHGGTITAKSGNGSGATFIVRLPCE